MNHEVWTIINTTPDSFYSASRAMGDEQIVQAASQAIAQGCTVLDIGAMSTRPGYQDVSPEDEFTRLDSAVGIVKAHFKDFPLSIDTFRSSVAAKIYEKYGAFTVNDISGGGDPDMWRTAGQRGLPYVMMSQNDTIENMVRFFELNIARAEKAGLRDIIIDPGFGFGKTMAQNFEILHQMPALTKFGRKILVGLSRKSMIWRTLDTTPDQALGGTTALHFEALRQGADILRAHDTQIAHQTIQLYETYNNHNR